jgi:hypothetical protein
MSSAEATVRKSSPANTRRHALPVAQVRRALLQQLAAAVVVLAWSARRMQQDRLKIRSQRQGLLPSARPGVGLCR